MPIFRLEDSELIIAQETDLELESHLEDWLENSPLALAQEPILWIGRQTSAAVEDSTIFPDLLGIDSEGNLVIVELKRDEAPRDVVAQLLEYAAWANDLSDLEIQEIADDYFKNHGVYNSDQFQDVLKETLDIPDSEELPPLNRNLRLYIVAEHIPSRITNVCRFLRISHGIDVNCIDVSTFQTEAGEKLVSMESKVGSEDDVVTKAKSRSGEKLNHQMVFEAVNEFTNGKKNATFKLIDIERVISEKHPNFNKNTTRRVIRGSCVNFSKRSSYPIGEDRYWWISRGQYRLYNPDKDAVAETSVSVED